METYLAELVALVPQVVLAAVVIWFVLRWQSVQNERDDQHIEQYRELVGSVTEALQANTEVLHRFCATVDLVAEIRRVMTSASLCEDAPDEPTDRP